jgi:hypothetical protein
LTDLASRAELEEFHDPEYIGSFAVDSSSVHCVPPSSSSACFLYYWASLLIVGSLLRGYDPQDNALGNKRGHTGSGRAFGSATSELDRPATEDTRSAEDENLEEFGLEHVQLDRP